MISIRFAEKDQRGKDTDVTLVQVISQWYGERNRAREWLPYRGTLLPTGLVHAGNYFMPEWKSKHVVVLKRGMSSE